MARSSARILDDDEELDLLDFMLEACGIDSTDFSYDERVLTKENIEKNFDVLLKMVENRSFQRASYFVIGYLILITGIRISDTLRKNILHNTLFSAEEGCWFDKKHKNERKIYLKDFQDKIQTHGVKQRLHPIRLIYFGGQQNLYTDKRSEVIIGLKELNERSSSKDTYGIRHILLQGEGLSDFPDSLFSFMNLESLSLEYNLIRYIPEEISKLTSLKTLYLDYNEFTAFPESLINLPSLEFLALDNNFINKLPESIKDFKLLRELFIRMNKINEIPSILNNVNFKIENKFYKYP